MTITVGPAPDAVVPVTGQSRWRRGRRVIVVLAVLLMAGGLVTFLSLRAHYRDAAPLTCACAVRWAEPDSIHVRNEQAGPWSAAAVPARPGAVQAFEVLLVNRSSVTQTIIRGPRNVGWTAEPVDVTFARATGSIATDQDDKAAGDFSKATAVLPPGAVRWVRYAIHTTADGVWSKGRTEEFTALNLKVRVGAWTRWQHIDFGNFAFVLSGT